jgi:hypothetical protein
MNYEKIIESVFNPNPHFPCTKIYQGDTSRVYRVDTRNPLIVRIASAGSSDYYEFQAKLLETIADPDNLTPRVLHWEMREIDNQACCIQIQTYLSGAPLDHYPNPDESKAIVNAVYTLHQRLCAVSSNSFPDEISTIDKIFRNLLLKADDGPIKEAGVNLIKNERYNALVAEEEQYLTHFDLWSKNLLLEQAAGHIEVKIVDFNALVLAPKIVQPAVFFSSCFLVSSLLFNSNLSYSLDLDEVIEYWPESPNKQDMLLMMQLYPVVIGLIKEEQFARNPSSVSEPIQGIRDLLMNCLQTIWQMYG